ncbi:hypothetical protein COCSUDRAFT_62819 [Coccomyxa subellipsoidea C-169]|uniref:Uncharacterized protein n=1 Tax=Coccomyxa subellipsoidea (strain C-169) TaxID=574566 RepID=I0Z100_COCSC|nr:hypothetical protein COCSUDRAFT_62819 [Coccomyxa subellipsoidea C-169]EIE24319.1 hypothetical protein COCSUDRAFT_62819 [Coccomyxa subellipsoidea C-169]|eukprot:XP_005648863.1 hypothetical protein COCSUDRAFT_62819 [Coccomyxa subellipsoidea C-169]
MPEDTLETGLSSLGGHSPQAAREPVWKKAVRTLAVYVASLVTLLVLDIVWMKGIAPALGVDYFAVIQAVQGSDAAGRPIGLIAYLIMGYAATFLAYNWAESMRLGFAIYGIFDFTSTYMYHGWTIKVAVLDTLWGTILFALTGLVLQLLRPRLHRIL